MRMQTDRTRLLQVQAQLGVVRHHWRHPTLREDPSLWVASARTRFQHDVGHAHMRRMCPAAGQKCRHRTARVCARRAFNASVHCRW